MVKGAILKVLGGFHNQVERSIMGMTERCTKIGEWEFPLVDEALETAGLWKIK